jgi:hypothetical protein
MLAACGGAGAGPSSAAREAGQPLPPSLRKELTRLSEVLHRAGLQERGPGLAGFMLSGSHATLPLVVPAGQCVTMVARATSGARDVDAALYSADGLLLALDSGTGSSPTLQACARDGDERAYYVIQFYEGDGSFVAQPFYGDRRSLRAARAAVGGKPAFAEIVSAPEALEDPASAFSEGLRKRGYDPVGEPRRFEIAQGEHVRAKLPVEAGQCYTVAVFGGAGVARLTLRLLDEHGEAVSIADDAQAQAATQLCARTTAGYALESEATAGAGEVVVLVYRVDVLTAGGEAGLWLGNRPSEASLRPAAKQAQDAGDRGDPSRQPAK